MFLRYIIYPLLLFICVAGVSCHKKMEILIETSIKDLFKPSVPIPPVFQKLSEDIDLRGLLKDRKLNSELPEQRKIGFCMLCTQIVDQAIVIYNNPNVTEDEFLNRVMEICVNIGLGNSLSCGSFISQNWPHVLYVMENTNDTDGNDICAMLFTGKDCISKKEWRTYEIEIPDEHTKPPIDETPFPEMSEVLKKLKILHLTDIHYDPDYEEGSNAECDEIYLCCQSMSSGDRKEGDEAGYWGDHRGCDIPLRTVNALLADAARKHPDIDLIFWTGDHVAHNIWTTSRDGNIQMIQETFDIILKYFPDTLVLPAVGNHDTHPVNIFPQPYVTEKDFDISWLYDELTEFWQQWLPTEVADTVSYGGFYAMNIRPGLRIISINSNYCYSYNVWLIMDSKDVAENLVFLADELQAAENAGDHVYVLSHMSPGHKSCHHSWSHQFNRIILRYENTVSGIFHGHTHRDHFEVYFDPSYVERPFAISYITPSQTAYMGKNPGYSILTAEGDFEGSQFRILDHTSYALDLEEANMNPNKIPECYKLYSFLEAFGLRDSSPKSITNLVHEMNQPDSSLFDNFYRYYHRDGSLVDKGCDEKCKKDIICRLFISDNSDHRMCKSLTK